MSWQDLKTDRPGAGWLILALGVLVAGLFYTLSFAFSYTIPGLQYSSQWEVTDLGGCEREQFNRCPDDPQTIQIGDKMTKIGEMSYEDFSKDRTHLPFSSAEPGQEIPIVVERDGQLLDLTWRIPSPSFFQRAMQLFAPLILFAPFWFTGTVILLFVRPRDDGWRLSIAFNYIIALWLVTGITLPVDRGYAYLLSRALNWVLAPVLIHLHIDLPRKLFPRIRKRLLIILYVGGLSLAILELMRLIPLRYSQIGALPAVMLSIAILVARWLKVDDPRERLVVRLMVMGISVSLLPGVLFWILPQLFGGSTPGLIDTTIIALSLPLLPLFYAYAIYKHRLGVIEQYLGQFMVLYGLFFLNVTILMLAYSIIVSARADVQIEIVTAVSLAIAVFLTAATTMGRTKRWLGRLLYGNVYTPSEVLRIFVQNLPVAGEPVKMAEFLAKDFAPALFIRETALALTPNSDEMILYEWKAGFHGTTLDKAVCSSLRQHTGNHIHGSGRRGNELSAIPGFGWVRLVIPLKIQTKIIGLWLFGRRDPDDFYSRSDIRLLEAVAMPVASTLENARLVKVAEQELEAKKKAQELQRTYADRLRLTYDLERAILAARSANEIADNAANGIAQILPGVEVNIVVVEQDGTTLRILGCSDTGEQDMELVSSLAQIDLELLVLLEKRDAISKEEVNATSTDISQIAGCGDAAMEDLILVPFMAGGKLLGWANFMTSNNAGFQRSEAEFATQIASSISVALHSAKMLEKLADQSSELKRLSAQLIEAQELERRHLSYELHDEIGQLVTAISMNLSGIDRALPFSSRSQLEELVADTNKLLQDVSDRIRAISGDLRPTMLRDLGLIPTLRVHVEDFQRRTGISAEFKSADIGKRFNENLETSIFRVVQEALNNVARHSSADTVVINLSQEDSVLRASIIDDGLGFDLSELSRTVPRGIGLLGMRERIEAVGGTFSIVTKPDQGVAVSIKVPIGEKIE